MIWLVLLACAGADSEQDTGVGWDGWADGFFATYCRACHSTDTPDRRGAPAGVDFGTPEDVALHREAICRVVLVDETMPVGGGVMDEDRDLLDRYLGCDLEAR